MRNDFPYGDPTVLQLGTGVLRAWVEGGREAAERYLWDVTSATVRDPAMGWLGAGVIYLLVAGGLKFLGTKRIKKRFGTCILRYSRFLKKKGDPQRKMEEMTLEMIMVNLARYGGKFWGMRIPEVSIKLADVMGIEVLRLMNVDPPVQKERWR